MLITFYWLGRKASQDFDLPSHLDLTVFKPLLGNHQQPHPIHSDRITSDPNLAKPFAAAVSQIPFYNSDFALWRISGTGSDPSSEDSLASRYSTCDVSRVSASDVSRATTYQELTEDSSVADYISFSDSYVSASSSYNTHRTVTSSASNETTSDEPPVTTTKHAHLARSHSDTKNTVHALDVNDVTARLEQAKLELARSSQNLTSDVIGKIDLDMEVVSLDDSGYGYPPYRDHSPTHAHPARNFSQGSIDSEPRSPGLRTPGDYTKFLPSNRAPDKRSAPPVDPLQFVKGSGASVLAERAKKLSEAMEKQKA